ncbi:MAG TPA: FtsX-like permease family protein [Vicinamibacterales bacterium]|nr:FtsX-like permease family protein [Vicinamibacterales bacterium]
MRGLLTDFTHAARGLRHRPGYSAIIVLTLALGLGVNTVAFSVVNALLLKPFHVANADKIGWVFIGTAGDPLALSSANDIDAIRRGAGTLDQVAGGGRLAVGYDSGNGAEQAWAQVASANFFEIVPPPMRRGRTFSAADLAATGAVPIVVSEQFWQRKLGAAADLSTLRVAFDRTPVVVVGVVADGYQAPIGVFEPDVWFPVERVAALGLDAARQSTDSAWLGLLARPKPGATKEAIEADLGPIAKDNATRAGRTADDVRVRFVWLREGHPELRGPLVWVAGGAMAGVGVVLLIACFNVAGLVLSRSHERQRELSVRAAMGAGRWRLARHLLAENLLLALLAGAAAVGVSAFSGQILQGLSLPAPIPQRLHFAIDGIHIAVSFALVLIAAVVPALVPIWRLSRQDPIATLRLGPSSVVGTRGQARAGRWFVAAQVAGSTAFLVMALLVVQSFRASASADLGFATDDVAVLDIDPAQHTYTASTARTLAADLLTRVGQDQRVATVALASRAPFAVGYPDLRRLSTDGRDCQAVDCPTATTYAVGPEYFDALRIPIRDGRVFRDDVGDRDAVVISEAAALALWPNQRAIGQTFREGQDRRSRVVVGVAGDLTLMAFGASPRPVLYRPMEEADFGKMFAVIARGRATEPTQILRDALHALDRRVPPASLQTLNDRKALPMWPVTVAAAFFTTCGVLACTMVAVGLFGLTYYTVRRRLREFGVRLAIGATPGDLGRLVMTDALRLLAPGLAVGVLLAFGLTRLIGAQLPGIQGLSPAIFVAAIAMQIGVTLLASWSPARRAGRVDPLTVLRE